VKEGQKEEGEDDDSAADNEDYFGVGANGGGRTNSAVVARWMWWGSRLRWQKSRKKPLPPCYRLQS
jgi:hypothetical protein